MNLVYIDNLVDVLIQTALKKEAIGQVYNVTNKDQVTMRDFIFTICDVLGLEKPQKSIPLPLARAIATYLEMHGRLTNKKEPPLLTKARVKVAGLNLDFDISKTVKELDYNSRVSIKEGLERTLKS
jgi:nucleoside-diphosphate-sugar epimerase